MRERVATLSFGCKLVLNRGSLRVILPDLLVVCGRMDHGASTEPD